MSNLWPILRHNQNLIQWVLEIGRRLMREVNENWWWETEAKMNCKLHAKILQQAQTE